MRFGQVLRETKDRPNAQAKVAAGRHLFYVLVAGFGSRSAGGSRTTIIPSPEVLPGGKVQLGWCAILERVDYIDNNS